MDRRIYGSESPLASTTGMSVYLANTTSNLSLDPGLFCEVPQGAPSVFDKAYTCGPHPSIQPTLLQVVRDPCPSSPFAGIHQECPICPVLPIHPSGSLRRTTLIKFIDSSQQGYESARPVILPIPNDGINPASINLTRDRPQEGGVSTNVSLGHAYQSTPAHPTSLNLSVPSTFPVISCGQTIVQDRERRVPKRPRGLPKTETDPAASLSRPSLGPRLGEKLSVSQRRHSCSICKLDYAQPQGLTRHQCEKHKARLCIYCREFAWGRPYLFREHLVKRHPGIDPDAAIEEASSARRSAKFRRGYPPPLPQVSIPAATPKCDSWGRAKLPSRSSQLTSLPFRPFAVTKLPILPPEIPYDSQWGSTEPANKEMYRQEDALLSELLNTNDERAVSPSSGGLAEAETNLGSSARTVKMRLSPALSPVPTPRLPFNRNTGNPVFVSPFVEQAEHGYSYHFPPSSVVERSGRTPSPPHPLGCNWTDIWLAGTLPGHI